MIQNSKNKNLQEYINYNIVLISIYNIFSMNIVLIKIIIIQLIS